VGVSIASEGAATAKSGMWDSEAVGTGVKSRRAASHKMVKTMLGFIPEDSPISYFHPTARLISYLFMSFLPLVFQTPELQLLLIAISIATYAWAGIPAKNLKTYSPMMVLIFLFIGIEYVFFPATGAGETPIMVGAVALYLSSLLRGLLVYTRVIALLFASIVYFSTNRERDILVALRTLHVPFAVSYFFGLVLRSAGTFIEDYHIVREAEKARGLDMSTAPFFTKVTHFPMYMIPLFTLAIRRSEDISMGLYAKGTVLIQKDKSKKRPDFIRTFYHSKPADYLLTAAITAIFVICWIMSIYYGAFSLSSSIFNPLFGSII
jgi:energy-coupling factor transporter transmembrane protein EcfT